MLILTQNTNHLTIVLQIRCYSMAMEWQRLESSGGRLSNTIQSDIILLAIYATKVIEFKVTLNVLYLSEGQTNRSFPTMF